MLLRIRYISLMDIIEQTRMGGSIRTGVSTRGAIALYRTSKAHAALAGRSYVQPEDVKAMAVPVLATVSYCALLRYLTGTNARRPSTMAQAHSRLEE